MPEDFDPRAWLTTQEAADLTHYNVRYLRQLVNEGKLTAVQRGGLFWLERASVAAYLAESVF
ncbi:MAG: helix-turn-helix domain-containing protein [Chloroflexi bacterium]|nr:helix-turn-helix domain-containing protein [Chloroflexota bacterium]